MRNHTRKIMCLLTAILLTVMLTACGPAGPAPSATPTIPGGIDGTVEGQTYKNGAAGFELTFPEGYTVLDKEQVIEQLSGNDEQAKGYFNDPEQAEQAAQNSRQKAIAIKYPLDYNDFNPNIGISVVKGNGEDPNDVVDITNEIVQEANQVATGITISPAEAAQIGGRPAAVAHWTNEGMDVLEDQYFLFNNDHLVIITLTASTQPEFDELVKALDNFTFY